MRLWSYADIRIAFATLETEQQYLLNNNKLMETVENKYITLDRKSVV